ncbi:hypothetical protein BO78DRAFT_374896 [Aspergillus sclerotiicarbonarius CBS 121057]|uniref:Zn(2)-C6 fungal-type domain-containing protein n=1 Tax=Aspergillus sclerotiicarbonarius (strain CBS 121057 / IBT 28362) TaxID=1448318 RepID=A0A319E1U6_ASPSB|nr:hypothetical protein BO78DRAFT_374896 [Aspergillus sclerotiicarbonarius CBS 121057]
MAQNYPKDAVTHSPRGNKRPDDGDDDPDQPSPKRQSRGRYVSKACVQCRHRKVKCDGRLPCRPCILSRRQCSQSAIDLRRRRLDTDEVPQNHNRDSTAAEANDSMEESQFVSVSACSKVESVPTDTHRVTRQELLVRLDRVERHLQLILTAVYSGSDGGTDLRTNASPEGASITTHTVTASKQKTAVPAELDSFSGETSIRHALDQVEGRLKATQSHHGTAAVDSPLSTPALTPSPRHDSGAKRIPDDISNVLQTYGIEPNTPQWDHSLAIFCTEIHVLYPFLHLPTLRANYNTLWHDKFTLHHESNAPNQLENASVAQLLICIAIGRCTESPRVQNQEGRHSAGWSLYGAASELLGDLLGCFGNCPDPLELLQTLALMTIYLFRLDIFGKAEKLLALAISHAHHLGLHRSRVVYNMSPFHSEISRRIWWCLYVLDRRLAIETGHPFLIQDVNADTPLPQEVSDAWLSKIRDCPSHEPNVAPPADAGVDSLTPIPYFRAMITYSKVLGKVWEGMYGATNLEPVPNYPLREHLESLLFRAQKDIRQEFAHPQYGKRVVHNQAPWWLVKQQALMRTRWLSLRLLIRRPMLQASVSPSTSTLDTFENEVTCMQIASTLIEEFAQIPEEKAVFTFPFIHYLIGATIVSLGLILKESTFKAAYGGATLHAVQLLESYCNKTWVSGKLIRVVSRLRQMANQLENSEMMGVERSLYKHSSQVFSENHTARTRHTHLTGEFPMTSDRVPLSRPSGLPVGDGESAHTDLPVQQRNPADPRLPLQDSSYTSLTNLVMSDFDFEEDVIGAVNMGILPVHSASSIPWPTHPEDTAGADLSRPRPFVAQDELTASESGAPFFDAVDLGGGGEMEWLEALFGNYLNPDLIIRQDT